MDPDGRWTFEFGLGLGVAGKIKIGYNEGKWEFLWRVGFGLGGDISLDISDNSFTEDKQSQLGIYIETEISGEIGAYSLGLEAQIGLESNVDEGGNQTLEFQNYASVSMSYKEIVSNMDIDDGSISISSPATDSSKSSSLGFDGMLFIGFGGSGVKVEEQ